MTSPIELIFDYLKAEELPTAVEIETEGYPADEAGSLESFTFRHLNAPTLFLGAYRSTSDSPRKLVGYVCSTLSSEKTLTHESMSNHVPESDSVCIHSVCVAKEYRRKGIALRLLKEYLARLSKAEGQPYKRVLLIAHEELRSFYEQAGFTWIGKSSVEHGSRPWFEMRHDLEMAPEAQMQIPADVLQSLLRPSSEKHSPTLVSDYHHGLEDLILKDESTGSSLNKYDLLCPRGCQSVILKAGSAQWAERTSVSMEPEDLKHALLPTLPPPPETAQWWLVHGSPMTFENIGFSRPSGMLSTGKRLKLLICAECDLGPLGWCEEGGSEYWLATSRVGYRK
ncbi:acyl-CoA N-acyltransferase [Ephemerocybe angulata]|uniref:Acyl-CoA N-acyltransferase n=1 Tax=Ephemerocybe angulata TaxID=980116 RepID=A0A8H6I1Y2_9AGAR|nr:acyl-CoA N-acyltransferase [Tulosesus angulatus]